MPHIYNLSDSGGTDSVECENCHRTFFLPPEKKPEATTCPHCNRLASIQFLKI